MRASHAWDARCACRPAPVETVPVTVSPSSCGLKHGIPGPGTLQGGLGHPRPRRPPYKSLPTLPTPPFLHYFAPLSTGGQRPPASLCCPPSLAATLCCSCPGRLLQVSAASPCASMRCSSDLTCAAVWRQQQHGAAQQPGAGRRHHSRCRSLSAKMPSQTVEPDPTTHPTPSPLCRP